MISKLESDFPQLDSPLGNVPRDEGLSLAGDPRLGSDVNDVRLGTAGAWNPACAILLVFDGMLLGEDTGFCCKVCCRELIRIGSDSRCARLSLMMVKAALATLAM